MASRIFVFGSNLAGRHGAGSAKAAMKKHRAIYGQGVGRQGASYAIPTKDGDLKVLSLDDIKPHVNKFLSYAMVHPELQFDLVAIGCGLAGYKPEQIAPLFYGAPANVNLPWEFAQLVPNSGSRLVPQTAPDCPKRTHAETAQVRQPVEIKGSDGGRDRD